MRPDGSGWGFPIDMSCGDHWATVLLAAGLLSPGYKQMAALDRSTHLCSRHPSMMWRRLYLSIFCADVLSLLADGEAPFSEERALVPVRQGKWVYRVMLGEQPQAGRCSPVIYLLSRSRVEAHRSIEELVQVNIVDSEPCTGVYLDTTYNFPISAIED